MDLSFTKLPEQIFAGWRPARSSSMGDENSRKWARALRTASTLAANSRSLLLPGACPRPRFSGGYSITSLNNHGLSNQVSEPRANRGRRDERRF